jgi:trypsin
MTRTRTLVVALLASLAFAPSASAIVGGTATAPGARPYVAYVNIDGLFACTGTLVDPTHVITAGHCSSITGVAAPTPIGQPGQLITVTLGSTTPDDPKGEKPGVARVIVPPDYLFTNGSENDVAVLELAKPSAQPPVKVAGSGEAGLWTAGTTATISGFGVTSEGGNAPDTLQEAKLPIVADSTSAAAYGSDFDPATMIGAGFPQGGVDTCQGDSGGPLLVPGPNGSERLVGDTSYGEGCARAGKPGIYGRVAGPKLREWIRSVAPGAVAP